MRILANLVVLFGALLVLAIVAELLYRLIDWWRAQIPLSYWQEDDVYWNLVSGSGHNQSSVLTEPNHKGEDSVPGGSAGTSPFDT